MAEDTVIRAEVILRSDGVPPQTNLDLICASAAGAYGPTLKEVATTGLDWIAANLRYMRQRDGDAGDG